MLEGVGIRAIARLTTFDRNTILSILPTAGGDCRSLLIALIRRVQVRYLQLDETRAFVHTKEKHLAEGDPEGWDDAYRWVGLDSETKLIISYLVGKRDGACANEFVRDLSDRILGRCQARSEGFKPYIEAVAEAWGADMDIAQLTKVYGKPDDARPRWYGSSQVILIIPTRKGGHPQAARISTTHVERSNLTVRMHPRRFTRLSNAFSKKLSH